MAQQSQGHQEELRKRVMQYALDEFLANGIRNVKMDDIAARLQISKRTLYEMFEDKENLLLESIRFQHEVNRRKIENIASQTDNPLEVFALVFNMKMEEVHKVSPQFISDAKRYSSILHGFEEESKKRNADMHQFFDICVEQGLFRADINYALIMRLLDLTSRSMMENEFYKEFPMSEIVYTMYDTFFRSICTQKGLEILDRSISKKGKFSQNVKQ
ncbi:MAG: TetR/AcrR family transcriptional regulator [Bacteroidaceae bacterium]|nr:TetR/AcrR family transcriptional regulator [Bacteroidaceae bacterium]